MKNIRLTIAYMMLAGAIALLTGCNGTKRCTVPQTDIPVAYALGNSNGDSTSMADMEWWRFYGDSILCDLIRRGLEQNKDILIAASRIEEMRALYGAAKSDMLPSLSANIYANHETNDYSGRNSTVDPEFGAKLTLSWEADLWKRLSWAKRKGEAAYMASVEDMRAMNMTVIAEIATVYFRLMALDSELDIVKRTLVTRSEGLDQAKLRFEGGLTSEMEYRQAQVEYNSTESLIPSLEKQIQLNENALRLLIGEYASGPVPRIKTILSEVVVNEPRLGVPSQLMQRRPDLRASEMKLRVAMADVGMAYADRFPRLTIGLTGGLENDRLADFLKSPFSYVVAGLTGPVFDFGKRKRQYEAKIAAYDQARLAYERNVMEAFGEVADAVASYRAAQRTARLKTDLRDAAMKYVELARLQYLGGTSLYINVLDAQRRYFDSQIALSNAVADEYFALVNLYKSLGGGGWGHSGTSPASASEEL